MKIILDTNSIYKDFLLSSPQIRTIEKYLSQINDELLISEVVFEEMVRHFREDYSKAIGSYKSIIKVSEVLGIELNSMMEIEKAVSLYRDKLQNRIKEIGGKVIQLPNPKIRSLFNRDIHGRKPFDTSGKGFRDTLIWESILEIYLDHSEDILLISNDKGFLTTTDDGGTILHEDLICDLKMRGIDPEQVKLLGKVKTFIDEYVVPTLDRVYRFDEPLEGTFVESLHPIEMLLDYERFVQREIGLEFLRLFRIERGYIVNLKILRWLEDARIMEAFDLKDNSIMAIIRTTLVVDANIFTDQQGFSAILDAGKEPGSLVMPPEPRWDADRMELEVMVRTHFFADVAIEWNSARKQANSVSVSSLALTEEGLG